MRTSSGSCGWVVAAAALASTGAAVADGIQRPNIVLVVADDLNTRLGCYGARDVSTPNVDRLAARGVRFDAAFCQFPRCSPSRTSFLSGLRPETTRVLDNDTPPRTYIGDVPWLPEYFRSHGYFTAGVGKISHGKFSNEIAWDEFVDSAAEAESNSARMADEPIGRRRLVGQPSPHADEAEPDGFAAQRAAQWILKRRDEPFFVAVGFFRPHVPLVAPKRYFDLYDPRRIALPKAPADDRDDVPPPAFTDYDEDRGFSERQQQEVIRAYQACVSFADAQLGTVLDAVESAGVADRTVVVLLGDHGFHLGEHNGMWRKQSLFEESARSPLVIIAPGKRAGVSPRVVELLDLYPTLTDLAGLPRPSHVQGTSLAPLLDAPESAWDKPAYTMVQRDEGLVTGRSIRTERFRYTEWGGPEAAELYDHQVDPNEFVNLAKDAAHAGTVAELSAQLRRIESTPQRP